MRVCRLCGVNKATSNGYNKLKTVCSPCNKKPWVRHKGDRCESCGFVPEHPCQLDVDHIDGNKFNNSLDNYMTLCANCHRLKTYQNGDFYNKKYKDEEIVDNQISLF